MKRTPRIIRPAKRKTTFMERLNSPWLTLVAVALFVALGYCSLHHKPVMTLAQLIDQSPTYEQAMVMREMRELYPEAAQ